MLICRALKKEKYASRRWILPMLQAEEDERSVKAFNTLLISGKRLACITMDFFFVLVYS
ncbi:hypothetical protein MKW92_050862 [Papaver armeniacum]|nr:hypothetical protein MKW92_050862 [Papaver armeniacum]